MNLATSAWNEQRYEGRGANYTNTPNANYNRNDSFAYKAYDGFTVSNVATINITVISVNDAPVTNPDDYMVDEDNTLTVAASGVLRNNTDIENDTLSGEAPGPVELIVRHSMYLLWGLFQTISINPQFIDIITPETLKVSYSIIYFTFRKFFIETRHFSSQGGASLFYVFSKHAQ